MNTISIKTIFSFFDKVSFISKTQNCFGKGMVYGITIDKMCFTFMIELENYDVQSGILENEMTLLEGAGKTHCLIVKSIFTLGDMVRFDSPTQKCSGEGKILAVTIDGYGGIIYLIEKKDRVLQPGILEDEITLLE